MTREREKQLAMALASYTTPSGDMYDPEFTEQIRKEAPNWFNTPKNSAGKKEQLLEMARSGEDKPHRRKHPLGQALSDYTSKSSGAYDQDFDTKIRELAPNWFVSRSDIANAKKEQLLEMARNGEDRPHSRKHPLGNALSNYTLKSSGAYDQDFDTKIRNLRPDWFTR